MSGMKTLVADQIAGFLLEAYPGSHLVPIEIHVPHLNPAEHASDVVTAPS